MFGAQLKVRDFMRRVLRLDVPPTRPGIRDPEVRARLIIEEAAETAAALLGHARATDLLREYAGLPSSEARDEEGQPYKRSLQARPSLVGVVDGASDLLVVTLGLGETVGVDLEPHFAAVHEANMRKSHEPKEGEPWKPGRKPPGWVGPEAQHRELLVAAGALEACPVCCAEAIDSGQAIAAEKPCAACVAAGTRRAGATA